MATRTSVATEDFTGTDGTDLGATSWAQLNDSSCLMRRISNQIRGSHSNPGAARHTGTYTDDQYAVIELTGSFSNSNMYIGVCARASADTNSNRDMYGYEVRDTGGNQTSRLFKTVNGTETDLGTNTAVAWSIGNTVEIECEGTTIRGMRNGTTVISVTDSALSTGKPGCIGFGAGTLTGDNWVGGNLTAGDVNTALSGSAATGGHGTQVPNFQIPL